MQWLLVNFDSSYNVFWAALTAVTMSSGQLLQLQCFLVNVGSGYNVFWSALAAVTMSSGQLLQQLQCFLVNFGSSYNVFLSTLAPAVECKQGWAVTDYPFIVSQISKVSNG